MSAEARIEALLAGFPPRLRAHGFAASPDRMAGFLRGVALLGPRGLGDIRAAALALFGVAPERRPEFDALFDAHFGGRVLAPPSAAPEEEDELRLAEDRPGTAPEPEGEREAGAEASRAERLGERRIEPGGRVAMPSLPHRRARRLRPASRGVPDLRRAAREAMRRDGELTVLPKRRRKEVPRRVVLLVDVSGSMAETTPETLRFAHALMRSRRDVECFTLGTRLTRVTRALRVPDRSRALAEASAIVADWDGGTRLGEALGAFLEMPRYAGLVRGALACVVSDGLDRCDPEEMARAVERLSRLAWRLVWLSPLSTGPDWMPQTEALGRAAPHVGAFGRAGGSDTLAAELARIARPERRPG